MPPFVKMFFSLLVVNLAVAGITAKPVFAHEIRPSIVDVEVKKNGKMELLIKLNLEAVVAGIGTGLTDTEQSENSARYDRVRKLEPEALAKEFREIENGVMEAFSLKVDGEILRLKVDAINIPPVGDIDIARTSELRLSAPIPAGAKEFTWSWAEELGMSVVRVKAENKTNIDNKAGVLFAAAVPGGVESKPIPLSGLVVAGGYEVFTQYISLGFVHIIPKGVDHILFVVGLFLLSAKLSSLLWQISSFTLAHTITLGLAMAGIISAPASFVEPMIALSIVFVAVENVMTSKLSRWRPVVVFLFGLLHGLGFASVLHEIGLQPANFIYGLLGFNIGVEFGQLTVILVCFLLVGFWFSKKPYYRRYITNPASIAIAVMGTFWFVERVFL